MENEIKKDQFGRIVSISITLDDGSRATRSVVYKSDRGDEISKYKLESLNSSGDRSVEIYDAKGQIIEDVSFSEGNIPLARHTYDRSPSRKKVEVGIYTGKDGHFLKVNFNYISEQDLKNIDPRAEFSDFSSEDSETALERAQREAREVGETLAERYAKRDGSLSDQPAPKEVTYGAPVEEPSKPESEAQFDETGKAEFDFGDEPETPGLGTH